MRIDRQCFGSSAFCLPDPPLQGSHSMPAGLGTDGIDAASQPGRDGRRTLGGIVPQEQRSFFRGPGVFHRWGLSGMGNVVRPHPYRIERERLEKPLRLNAKREEVFGPSFYALPLECPAALEQVRTKNRNCGHHPSDPHPADHIARLLKMNRLRLSSSPILCFAKKPLPNKLPSCPNLGVFEPMTR